jgi:hypothetical protein
MVAVLPNSCSRTSDADHQPIAKLRRKSVFTKESRNSAAAQVPMKFNPEVLNEEKQIW